MNNLSDTIVNNLPTDSINNSFLKNTRILHLDKLNASLTQMVLKGNIILYCDTTLVIDSTTHINNAIICARSIKITDGFNGNGQFFALDSIAIGKRCVFTYPSAIGTVRADITNFDVPTKIVLGTASTVNGIIFNAEPDREVKPLIELNNKVVINGQIYSQGYLSLPEKGVTINGSVTTLRFLYNSGFSRYENYLINTTIDADALSSYYITSPLFNTVAGPSKIMQWLN